MLGNGMSTYWIALIGNGAVDNKEDYPNAAIQK